MKGGLWTDIFRTGRENNQYCWNLDPVTAWVICCCCSMCRYWVRVLGSVQTDASLRGFIFQARRVFRVEDFLERCGPALRGSALRMWRFSRVLSSHSVATSSAFQFSGVVTLGVFSSCSLATLKFPWLSQYLGSQKFSVLTEDQLWTFQGSLHPFFVHATFED